MDEFFEPNILTKQIYSYIIILSFRLVWRLFMKQHSAKNYTFFASFSNYFVEAYFACNSYNVSA